jgi:phosphonate transport system substrate-binding protein
VVKGQHAYRSLLVTHRDSEIRGIADLVGARGRWVFGDGDPKSTSGHVVPRYYAFIKRGINEPDTLFREVRRGSHLDNMLRTAGREVDVATTNTTELALLQELRPEAAQALRVIWESPDIPESPLVWKPQPAGRAAATHPGVSPWLSASATRRSATSCWPSNNLTGFRRSSNAQLTVVADLEMFKRTPAHHERRPAQPAGAQRAGRRGDPARHPA